MDIWSEKAPSASVEEVITVPYRTNTPPGKTSNPLVNRSETVSMLESNASVGLPTGVSDVEMNRQVVARIWPSTWLHQSLNTF